MIENTLSPDTTYCIYCILYPIHDYTYALRTRHDLPREQAAIERHLQRTHLAQTSEDLRRSWRAR